MSSSQSKDHPFEVDLDVVKFDEQSDRVKLVGYLGKRLTVRYEKGILLLSGDEGSIKIHLDEEDLSGIR